MLRSSPLLPRRVHFLVSQPSWRSRGSLSHLLCDPCPEKKTYRLRPDLLWVQTPRHDLYPLLPVSQATHETSTFNRKWRKTFRAWRNGCAITTGLTLIPLSPVSHLLPAAPPAAAGFCFAGAVLWGILLPVLVPVGTLSTVCLHYLMRRCIQGEYEHPGMRHVSLSETDRYRLTYLVPEKVQSTTRFLYPEEAWKGLVGPNREFQEEVVVLADTLHHDGGQEEGVPVFKLESVPTVEAV